MFYAIVANDLSFELPDGRELLKNLNFSLDNQLSALVGPNGIGKTTLAKFISGEFPPSSGNIQRNTTVTFFSQRETPQNIPVYEYLLNNYSWSAYIDAVFLCISPKCEQLTNKTTVIIWMRHFKGVSLLRILDIYLSSRKKKTLV